MERFLCVAIAVVVLLDVALMLLAPVMEKLNHGGTEIEIQWEGGYSLFKNKEGDYRLRDKDDVNIGWIGSFDDYEEGIVPVKLENGDDRKYGYVNEKGEVVIEPAFDDAESFSEGFAVAKLDGLYGFIDVSGAFVIEPQYGRAESFLNGYAAVAREVIPETGEYTLWGMMDGKEVFSSNKQTFWGLIDREGKVTAELQYDWLERKEGVQEIVARKDEKCGLIDADNNVLVPFEYDTMYFEAEDDRFVKANMGDRGVYFDLQDPSLTPVAEVDSSLNVRDYYPNEGAKVAVLDGEAEIVWDEGAPLPRLDGATALLPVYSAFAQAVYPEDTRYMDKWERQWDDDDTLFTCTKTNEAYGRLISGAADVIFCAGPSDAQIAAAAEAGVEFELTPFGKEAFVFIVNKDNPLEGIGVAQIRQVYSGAVTQWDELGVDGIGEIVAYQRPADSGSQTALERLMGDVPIIDPLENMEYFMDGVIEVVEEYRNWPNAIGYTFRFFCTEMIGSDVKLLAMDGVAPTVENIRNGSYPICSTLYAVTRKGEENPNVRILLDWVTGAQGAELVEKSGYVFWKE